jgi:major type 1 subunit fimbrin (pilin)
MIKRLATVGLLAMAGAAYAADGTVNVTGSVSGATCTIATSAAAVGLPNVSRSALASAGSVAGLTPWSVSVSACNAITMNAYFEAGPTVNASGRMSNSGTAGNVDGQLLNSSFGVINMAQSYGSQGTTPVTLSGNAATQQFYVRYYATGTVTAGTFISSFTYTLVYT